MKFEIKRTILLNALRLCERTTDQTNNLILGGILIDASSANGLTIVSSNNNVSCKNKITEGLSIHSEGTILVKSNIVFNIINKIRSEYITIQKIDESVLRINSENFTCDINLLEENTYPILNFDFASWQKINVSQKLFSDLFTKLSSFVSIYNDGSSILNGICIDTTRQQGIIEAVATDSFHLGYLKEVYNGPEFKIVIGVDNLKILNEVANKDDKINLYVNANKIIFAIGNILFSCRLLDGAYPSTIKAIESKLEYSFKVSKNGILDALDRANVLNHGEKKPTIVFKIKNDNAVICSKSVEYGNSSEQIDIYEYNGNPMDICLNVKFLSDLLKNIDQDTITFELSSPNKQIIVRDHTNPNYVSLVLPIRNI